MNKPLKDLEEIHRQMRENEKERLKIKDAMAEIYPKTSLIRAKTEKEIAFEKDAHKKPKFSNENLRRAELIIRLAENEEYKELSAKREALQRKDSELAIEWNMLVDKRDLLMLQQGLKLTKEVQV